MPTFSDVTERSPTVPLDEVAVAALSDRDPDAVAAAYDALADPLFRYVRSRAGDPELAADVVEVTFLELVEQAPSLSGGLTGLRRWLFTAARHNLLDEQRTRRRRGQVALTTEPASLSAVAPPAPPSDPGGAPEEAVLAADRDASVRDALADLPPDQQEVLRLRFAADLSAAETGELMARSPGAVRVLQHRALQALAAALDHRHPEAPPGPTDGALSDADHSDADHSDGAPSDADRAGRTPRSPRPSAEAVRVGRTRLSRNADAAPRAGPST